MDRAAQFAVVCAREAVEDSGLDLAGLDPHRIGVSLGSAVAAATSLEREYLVLSDSGRSGWSIQTTCPRTCSTTWPERDAGRGRRGRWPPKVR